MGRMIRSFTGLLLLPLVGCHSERFDRDAGGKVQALEIENTAKCDAIGIDDQWESVALWDRHFGFDVLDELTDTQLRFGDKRTHFNAVMKCASAPSQVVGMPGY